MGISDFLFTVVLVGLLDNKFYPSLLKKVFKTVALLICSCLLIFAALALIKWLSASGGIKINPSIEAELNFAFAIFYLIFAWILRIITNIYLWLIVISGLIILFICYQFWRISEFQKRIIENQLILDKKLDIAIGKLDKLKDNNTES